MYTNLQQTQYAVVVLMALRVQLLKQYTDVVHTEKPRTPGPNSILDCKHHIHKGQTHVKTINETECMQKNKGKQCNNDS